MVRAWWLRGELVECRIGSLLDNQNVYVQPLHGNPHSRIIGIDELDSRIGGHAAETL